MTLDDSGGENCYVNTEQFLFELYSAGQKLRSVVLLAFSKKKNKLRSRAQWFKREIPAAIFILKIVEK